jgi:hypothetical protein
MLCGFLAIKECIEGRFTTNDASERADHYVVAVWFILFACLCDLFDGRVARATHRESLFGAEFDSIAMGARSKDNLEEADLLFSVTDWAEVGTGDTLHYEAEFNLTPESIAAKFPVENVTKRAQEALLDIELINSGDPTLRRTIVSQWPVRIDRDIYRGTEGVPVEELVELVVGLGVGDFDPVAVAVFVGVALRELGACAVCELAMGSAASTSLADVAAATRGALAYPLRRAAAAAAGAPAASAADASVFVPRGRVSGPGLAGRPRCALTAAAAPTWPA